MAIRTLAQFKALYGSSGSTFPDNTTGDISESDMRQFGEDIADSIFPTSLFQVTGTMSSADILNSNSVPIELIPAPGAGIVTLPVSIAFFLDFNSIAYATFQTCRLEIGTGVLTNNLTNMLAAVADQITIANVLESVSHTTGIVNQAVKFRTVSGNPTAGNSTIKYDIVYRLVNNFA